MNRRISKWEMLGLACLTLLVAVLGIVAVLWGFGGDPGYTHTP